MTGDATTLLTSQIGAAAACSYVLNLLQRWSRLPWITEHTKVINVIVRAVLAGAATLGISKAWTPTTGGGGVLMISIPPFAVLVQATWHWFSQYALTHLAGSALENGHGGVTSLPAPKPAPVAIPGV